jgi:starch synthase
MKILMVASEAAPFAKTGGLADVLGALPPALAGLGEEVAVVLPRYRAVASDTTRIWDAMPLWAGPHGYTAAIDEAGRQGVRYLFVDCPALYDRAEIYGTYPDNHIRFAFLSQAAIGVARNIFRPDVFHGHDWQTGLLGAYLRTNLAGDPTFFGTKVAFTIHNLGYQGNFPPPTLSDLGLRADLYHPDGLELTGRVSFLKAGIVWADAITTVSPTYAREIQTPEYGFGMEADLRARARKLTGILNGVDYAEWDPRIDPHIAAKYSAGDLSGKAECKRDVLEEMGLPCDSAALRRPLIGMVSRLATQKGFDLVAGITPWLVRQDAALAVFGSGEARFEKLFRDLAAAHPDRIGVRIGFDNALAHRIEAGADMFLMPSLYEPCGLNQIYSLRYGTVPIVRATGGLDDAVDLETGFKFRDYTAAALQAAIAEALAAFESRQTWIDRMRKGMAKDFSWDASAAAYQRLYNSLR